jgi:hypothetical protein
MGFADGIGGWLIGSLPSRLKTETIKDARPSSEVVTPMGIGLGGKM